MKVTIRQMGAADRAVWAEMHCALWPDGTLQEHFDLIDEMLGGDDAWAFIAETLDRAPAGFAEIAIRKYANGCDSRPVPFLEGIWVKEPLRRQGIGGRLIRHVAALIAANGFHELGSDALIDNIAAHAAHAAWGFSETERVVYFRKHLTAPNR